MEVKHGSYKHNEATQGYPCSLCYQLFKDPRIMSCGHSFCHGCLDNFFKQFKDPNRLSGMPQVNLERFIRQIEYLLTR